MLLGLMILILISDCSGLGLVDLMLDSAICVELVVFG